VAALALLLRLPALSMPFTTDDFAQHAMMAGDYPTAHPGVANLYDFVDDANRFTLVDDGILPWWTHPGVVVRFLRPLSSLTLALDYRLSPNAAGWGHAHSLVWWAAGMAAVYALLAGMFSRRVARFGVLVFALSPCDVVPLAWLANREALVSLALTTAALAVYVRWRRDRRPGDAAAAFALFALAMLAGEYSLAIGGYVLALEILRPREGARARAVGAAPFVVPVAAYLLVRSALHYGARNSGVYHDPFVNFSSFARGALWRAGTLLGAGWLGLDDLVLKVPSPALLAAILAAGAALIAFALQRALGALSETTRRNAGWLALGSLLSVAPLLAVEPALRLLGIPMIGVSAVVALILDRALFGLESEPKRWAAWLTACVALGLALTHFIRAPVSRFLSMRTMTQLATARVESMDWLRHRAASKSAVVVVRANSLTTAMLAPCALDLPHLGWRVLSYQSGRVFVMRTSGRSLELVANPNPIFPVGEHQIFRTDDGSLQAGDVVRTSGMTATVVQLDTDHLPRRVRFDFDFDLDDDAILWVKETASGQFELLKLPPTGQGKPI
jgi:hypothetical protein